MNRPKISVVIPAYQGAEYLGEAIQSVLDQTYTNFELIIVDDASPEDTSVVMKKFTDARIKYIKHKYNQGAVAARKTGVHASSGEIIAFLDQDDLFHELKLEAHAGYLSENPQVGLSYNGRFEVLGPEKTICGIYVPPEELHLADWVLGFPLSPSDMVLKREWAVQDQIWDDSFSRQTEHVIFNGQEIIFGGRLTLAGCTFGNVGRALNYRRYHPDRVLNHLLVRCRSELDCQNIIFSDPCCPDDVKAVRNLAFSNIYVMWAYTAYIQEEYDLGRNFLKQALTLNPDYFTVGDPCEFLDSWLLWISSGTVGSVRGEEEIIRSIFGNLPQELQFLESRCDWAIARCNLLKGLRGMIWGEAGTAGMYIRTAVKLNACLDTTAMSALCDELLNYESELGGDANARRIIDDLSNVFKKLNRSDSARSLAGFYWINRAYRNYHNKKYNSVPGDVLQAIMAEPKYLLNKGALSVLFHSILWRTKLVKSNAR
jgi:glycosyltransferase involved in cell wall biosynthesis